MAKKYMYSSLDAFSASKSATRAVFSNLKVLSLKYRR